MKIPTKTITIYEFDKKRIEMYQKLFNVKYPKEMVTLIINLFETSTEGAEIIKNLKGR